MSSSAISSAKKLARSLLVGLLVSTGWLAATEATAADESLNVLFLGDDGSHGPRERFARLEPVLRDRGITLIYTERVSDLNAANLAACNAVLVYANIDHIEPAEEQALLRYVEGGGGFVPVHCASYCFRNSKPLIELMGAQFQRHGWARVREDVVLTNHPVIKDYSGFESWDESYVHHMHNENNRTVLSYRVEGDEREPWTWVRTHGKGRVFYTAWGHDWHTWCHPGFHNLVERGIRWAAGKDPSVAGSYLTRKPFATPKMTKPPNGPAPFEYVDVGAKIPNYVPSKKWGEQGEPLRQMQKPLAPAESMRRMVVPEGFHVELFAAEPDLGGKPLCMAWDERGRLWLGESLDYPNELEQNNRGHDRIRICEDTDGDNVADKFTVFAEDLSIPTSITFHRGGILVHNGTETTYLKDTDGDDRADERRVVFTGWSMGDTHGGPSNMQYGLDNWIWGMQGYNNSTIESGGKSTRFAQGFHRFRPDGSAFEFIRSTNNNTWGFGASEEGIIFGSTANGNPSIYMPIPNRYYEQVRGWTPQLTLSSIADSNRFQPITDKVRQVDHHGGHTAAAGHALYTARAYPEQYWNRTAFVCEPTGHLISTFVLSADGADFHSTSPANLLASDDEWTAPIMAEVGPDGNVWIIDWYNYIVQHNPTPEGFDTGKGRAYETDLRDKKHARIYRVVFGDRGNDSKLDLSQATPDELTKTLKNDNLFWRRHAQRLLVERGQLDIVPQLLELIRDYSVDAIGLNVGAIHALWTLHGLGAIDAARPEVMETVVTAIKHPSSGVRRNAIQVLPATDASTAAIVNSSALSDPDAQVRLQALLTLADVPANPAVGKMLVQILQKPEFIADRWLLEAATSAASVHGIDFLIAAAASSSPTSQLGDACEVVANHIARSSPNSIERVLVSLTATDPRLAGSIIEGLCSGLQPEAAFQLSEDTLTIVEELLGRLPLENRVQLASMIAQTGAANMQPLFDQLIGDLFKQVQNNELRLEDRASAARLIVSSRPNDIRTAEKMLELATPKGSPELNLVAIRALRESTAADLGGLITERIETLTPSSREAAIDLLLSRTLLTTSLLDAIENGLVGISDLSLTQKQQLSQHPDRSLKHRAQGLLEKAQGRISEDRKKVLAEFADVTTTKANATNGKSVFLKNCAVCHKFQGEGAAIGPDLSGMAIHGKEQLLAHILDPNRDVEGNYQAYTVVLQDGRVLNGLLGGESSTSIELIDAEGKRQPLLREDIDELTKTGTSLMPEGFEKQLSRSELSDLLEFLTQRSQFVPLDLRRVATVSSAHGMFQTPGSSVESLMFDDWGVKTCEGVAFYPVDPQGGRVRNVIMLHGNLGNVAPNMPHSVELPCGLPVKAFHLLSGVSGWGYPATNSESVTMIVRLHYADGATEDHPLLNKVHFADYLGHTDVSGSKKAFSLGRQQLRYLKIEPKRDSTVDRVELVKGPDRTAPLVMCITLERR